MDYPDPKGSVNILGTLTGKHSVPKIGSIIVVWSCIIYTEMETNFSIITFMISMLTKSPLKLSTRLNSTHLLMCKSVFVWRGGGE